MAGSSKITGSTNPRNTKVPQQAEIDFLKWLMIGLVVVLFIGFAGMFVATASMMVDALKDNRGSTNDLSDQLKLQDEKIDELTRTVKEVKDKQD